MPRKVTKTMREARKRAAQQKRERREYQASLDKDWHWSLGDTDSDTRRVLHAAKKRSPEPGSLVQTKHRSSKPDSVFLDMDFSDLEKSVLDKPKNQIGATSGRFSTKALSRSNIPKTMSEEEYQKREEAARQEIERKKTCIAPAYNKGAYQYIASEEMAKDAGKKK